MFYKNDATLRPWLPGRQPQQGEFVQAVYEARLRRNPDRIQVLLIREGNASVFRYGSPRA